MLRGLTRRLRPKWALYAAGFATAVVLATLGIEYDSGVLRGLGTLVAVLSVGLLVEPGVPRREVRERRPDRRWGRVAGAARNAEAEGPARAGGALGRSRP